MPLQASHFVDYRALTCSIDLSDGFHYKTDLFSDLLSCNYIEDYLIRNKMRYFLYHRKRHREELFPGLPSHSSLHSIFCSACCSLTRGVRPQQHNYFCYLLLFSVLPASVIALRRYAAEWTYTCTPTVLCTPDAGFMMQECTSSLFAAISWGKKYEVWTSVLLYYTLPCLYCILQCLYCLLRWCRLPPHLPTVSTYFPVMAHLQLHCVDVAVCQSHCLVTPTTMSRFDVTLRVVMPGRRGGLSSWLLIVLLLT